MGSEQSTSQPPKRQAMRTPPVRRGHTIAVSNIPGKYYIFTITQLKYK